MADLSYYFALSLDGYIARLDGSVDWLDQFSGSLNSPYDCEPFVETVTALITGRKTFEVSLTLGPWDFGGRPAYLYTRNPDFTTDEPTVTVVHQDIPAHVRRLKQEKEGRIWLLGGGELAACLLDEGLIDELVLTIMPVTIGSGIPWMATAGPDCSWDLAGHFTSASGMVQLVYRKKLEARSDP